MSLRNLSILLIVAGVVAVVIFFLRPCAPGAPQTAANTPSVSAPQPPVTNRTLPPARAAEPETKKTDAPVEKPAIAEKNAPPAPKEIDTAPPVNLTDSEVMPDIGRCAIRNFPPEARPYVATATVTVRLVVSKFGDVRSNTPISVEFPPDVEEDQVPAMRKLFITAAARAFGAKKCPPHIVNGQPVGYAIEVPLAYKR